MSRVIQLLRYSARGDGYAEIEEADNIYWHDAGCPKRRTLAANKCTCPKRAPTDGGMN